MTLQTPENFYPQMQRLCAACGVALVLVPALPKTYICGATFWRSDKAILALSVRGKRADIFWFSFFHELTHLVSHSKKESRISCVNEDGDDEQQADAMVSNFLIPDEEYRLFLDAANYADRRSIMAFADQMGIGPCIVVGRLLHDKLISFGAFDSLRPLFEIRG